MDGYSLADVHAIARKHGLPDRARQLPRLGMVNDIWSLGEQFIVRIPLQAEWEKELHVEALLVPAATSAGVATARLVVFDEDRDIVPVAYNVFEQVQGQTLGTITPIPEGVEIVLQELAEELVRLHTVTAVADPRGLSPPRISLIYTTTSSAPARLTPSRRST